jgi:preprotein translocase subunit YajC
MTLRKKLLATGISAALFAAGAAMHPAFAQAAQANIAAGAQVKDTAGGDVGTVTKVDGQFVILKTDKHEVRLPVSSFTAHQGHFIMAMTRDQLNAEVDKTKAAASAKLVAGATVTGSQGGNVGTIEAIDDQFVTVKLTSGKMVRLPRPAIAPGPNGGVIGMTVAELEAAAAQATAGAETEPKSN